MTDDQLTIRVEQACHDLLTAGAEITFAEVATRAGIARATFYRRTELRAIVEERRQRGRDALTGLQVEIDQLRATLETVAANVRRHDEQLRASTRTANPDQANWANLTTD